MTSGSGGIKWCQKPRHKRIWNGWAPNWPKINSQNMQFSPNGRLSNELLSLYQLSSQSLLHPLVSKKGLELFQIWIWISRQKCSNLKLIHFGNYSQNIEFLRPRSTYQPENWTTHISTCADQLFLLAFGHIFHFLLTKFFVEKSCKMVEVFEPIVFTLYKLNPPWSGCPFGILKISPCLQCWLKCNTLETAFNVAICPYKQIYFVNDQKVTLKWCVGGLKYLLYKPS